MLSDELDEYGVQLHIVATGLQDRSDEGQLLTHVRGSFAEYERAKIIKRTFDGQRGRAQAGTPSANAPLGYRYVKHERRGGTYVIDQDEAALVERIFHMYVTQGRSLKSIACELTQERIPTYSDCRHHVDASQVSPWYETTVSRILNNEVYIGQAHWGRRQRQPGITNPDKKTAARLRPRDEWVDIAVPAIIPPEVFDAARTRKQHNSQEGRRNKKHDYLLGSARLRCGLCGYVMNGNYNTVKRWKFYRCSRPKQLTGERCPGYVGGKKSSSRSGTP
jgi:site-specific DNA recombinase